MGILLNPELERRIALKMKSGFYRSEDDVIEQGLELLDAREPSAATVETRVDRPIWEIVEEIGRAIPEEAWRNVPADLSKNIDHYLYGAPKAAQ